MQRSGLKPGRLFVLAALLLGACAQQAPVVIRPPVEPELIVRPPPPDLMAPEIEPEPDPGMMADVPGDKRLPALDGEIERIDCKTGIEDLHARMAMEARGGHIAGFAYYSKWRPRTCSMDIQRKDPGTKWRLTKDGATRVQTPHGSFLIRVHDHAFVFEFHEVERRQYCGMSGHTSGTMTIQRRSAIPECSVAGLLDRDE